MKNHKHCTGAGKEIAALVALLAGCVNTGEIARPVVPSAEYSNYIRATAGNPGGATPYVSSLQRGAPRASQLTQNAAFQSPDTGRSGMVSPATGRESLPAAQFGATPRAQLRLVDGGIDGDGGGDIGPLARADVLTNEQGAPTAGFREYRSRQPEVRDYTGPLPYGDPGTSASLWRETRAENDLYRDIRAFQPMDLLTILVSESDEGKKAADTETKGTSSVLAGITHFLGLESYIKRANNAADPAALVQASTANNFKGEGTTDRKGELTAKISAMVVEVLPSGILRIEGEKIIAVNNEEQVMVISGLVRPRDVSSENEVQSGKIANMRVDYYGKGVLGEAQYGGWLGRAMRVVWPF